MNVFLDNLKVGDKVFIRHYEGSIKLRYIVRETKTTFVIQNKNALGEFYDVKYKKTNGQELGGSLWYSSYLCEYNEDNIKEYENGIFCNKFNQLLLKLNGVKDLEVKKNIIKILEPIMKM